MDQELDKRLKGIEYKLNENTQLLKRIRRVQRNHGLFRLFYWLIIIGLAFGSFYYIAPYIKQVKDVYTNTLNVSFPELNNLKSLMSQFEDKKE